MDFFSNEPLFINLESDKAFGYCLEGPELDSGIFFQLDLKKLRENNKKKLKKDLTNILLTQTSHLNKCLCTLKIQ